MKQRALIATIGLALTGIAADAGAVALNPKGLGQVLIYPYYTVNKGQDTMISVVNPSDRGKAIKVRFFEGYNSREVLDFALFLSPHDVWTAVVTQPDRSDDGGAVLKTADKSCMYPPLPASGAVPFRKNAYAGGAPAPFDRPDAGPQGLARTREGSVELITWGDVRPGSETERRIAHESNGHPNQGQPSACGELTLGNFMGDLDAPGNDLFGSGAIINVDEGTFYPYNADAISGFTDIPLYSGSSALQPTLQQANSAEATQGNARAYVFAGNRQIGIDYAKGEDAVSAVFMADSIYNEVVLTSALGANTDWILSFPTKRYYTDEVLYSGVPYPPFTHAFAAPGKAPVEIDYRLWDQEEMWVSDPCGPGCGIPPALPPLTAPYSVNALAFRLARDSAATESGVFGSRLLENVGPTFPGWEAGWAELTPDAAHKLPGGKAADGSAVTLYGLPVTGFMAYNVVNAQARPGKLANYSGVFEHRSKVSCTAATPQGPCS